MAFRQYLSRTCPVCGGDSVTVKCGLRRTAGRLVHARALGSLTEEQIRFVRVFLQPGQYKEMGRSWAYPIQRALAAR